MIDSTTLTYELFHDPREGSNPEFDEGCSGEKYIATDKSGKKYLVKHVNYTDAGNEFLGCWLAEKMGVLAPKAYLLTPNPKFKSCAVAIEFWDGLTRIPDEANLYETAAIFALHTLLENDDSVQMQGLNGHICTYDFADSFAVGDIDWFGSNVPEAFFAFRLRSYRAFLDFTDFDFSLMANNRHLDPDEFNRKAIVAARKILDIPDEEFTVLFDELSEIYPTVVVEYYADCLSAIQEKVSEI